MRSTEPDRARRAWLARAGGCALALAGGPVRAAVDAASGDATASLRLAAAWRGPRVDDPQQVGLVHVPADGDRVRFDAVVDVPSRAHGLLALPDGGFAAVAFRPGDWLWRLDRDARVVARHRLARPGLHFSGHVVASPDGGHLLATATDAATGAGWITVHAGHDLSLQAIWPSGGIEPHQLVPADDGSLFVAHGGLRRDAQGRRIAGADPQASLSWLDGRDGRPLGHWRLDDPALSIRHLAWQDGAAGTLGVALQAEHDDPARRRDAPAIARWTTGHGLAPVDASRGLGGLAGDIAAAAGTDGWVFSQAAAGSAWIAAATAPGRDAAPAVQRVAALREAGALATRTPLGTDDAFEGTWIAAARGLARWHPQRPARLLAWPQPIAPDNHLAVLVDT